MTVRICIHGPAQGKHDNNRAEQPLVMRGTSDEFEV